MYPVNNIEKIEITYNDRVMVIKNPLFFKITTSKKSSNITDLMVEYDSQDVIFTQLDGNLGRICIWCQVDISKIPIDSTNCCYCGGELDEDEEEPEGAIKSAPPENTLAISAPSINISEEILKNLKIRFGAITLEDKSEAEDEDYLPLVPEPIDQNYVEPKNDKVPYMKFNTKTNKYEVGYYEDF